MCNFQFFKTVWLLGIWGTLVVSIFSSMWLYCYATLQKCSIAQFTCTWQWCLPFSLKTGCNCFTALLNYCANRLDRFEKTNEMLINFNGLSNVRLQQMNERFLLHTRTLVEMKKDLDSVFRRIRSVFTTSLQTRTKRHTHTIVSDYWSPVFPGH